MAPAPMIAIFMVSVSFRSWRIRNGCSSVPMPSISTSTVLPGFIEPTPTEVPHRITSPGSSVMSCEIRLTSRGTEKRMSLIG